MSKKNNNPKKEEPEEQSNSALRFVHFEYSNAMLTLFLGDCVSESKNIITFY